MTQAVTKYNIYSIIVPEAILLTQITRNALDQKGVSCKIISALHNMPGYERIRIHIPYFYSLVYNKSVKVKLLSFIKLIIFPLYRLSVIKRYSHKFNSVYRCSDKVILLSERYFDDFISLYRINDGGEKLEAIGNGLSFDIFANDTDLISKKKEILVVSRFDERSKRISLIFKLWKRIQCKFSDWELVIAGSGEFDLYYKSIVKKDNLINVRFVGMVAPQEYYRNAKIFLMTSAYEGWPMTITEAQQMGCIPIVMNTFKSVVDIIINNENGYIVSNISEMEDAVCRLIENESLLNHISKNAINSSHRFERDTIYEKYYRLLKSL